ncbi:AraC family transcriptional regulator ligand-binding domain-containing protein [Roseibium porphyridii]|uniref:AraC family transcriptional regulator ligand-binding domain-containing protein n=1 Tax=Roseibium porphyridii TaxID=2866279 RepID=A0ABY8F068_9HYPH|nr:MULTISPECIES: AraC family transcriptional regulator [Stappiaceae]QFT33452.1 Transcriptional activator NphR [Labrenzia sp. THAF82]WFE88724.1 AraC family transcriptional regulator ligand-binding domain-containing protein [Roseibium sp. KMA01]
MSLDGEWARADVFRVLRDICSNEDLDWPYLAQRYNFDLASLEDPQGVVPITAWHGVFEYIAEKLGNDAVMFDLFNNVDIGCFSIFDYLFACAPTLRDACQAWVKFISIRTNAYRMTFEEDETGGYVQWPILEGRGEWRQNMFARMGWATQQLEHALDMKTPPIMIELATSEPKNRSAFQKKYQGRIRFNAPHNRIALPKALLSRPLRRNDAHLYDIILKSALSELDRFGELEAPLSRIANEVASNLADGSCTLPHVAAKLGMSQRAVQRLLEKEGTSFRKLSEEIRRSAAERYLRSTDLPMKEIAYLLGFSELSTFSRAVKAWFGVSPRKVREAPEKPLSINGDPASDDSVKQFTQPSPKNKSAHATRPRLREAITAD